MNEINKVLLDTIERFPYVNNNLIYVSSKVKLGKEVIVYLTLIAIILFILRRESIIVDILSYIYGLHLSIDIIESSPSSAITNRSSLCGLILFWVIFSLIKTFEKFTIIARVIPFYYMLKSCFMVWLLHPTTNGSTIIYQSFKSDTNGSTSSGSSTNHSNSTSSAENKKKSDDTSYELTVKVGSVLLMSDVDVHADDADGSNNRSISKKRLFCELRVDPPEGRRHIPLGIEGTVYKTDDRDASISNEKVSIEYTVRFLPLLSRNGMFVLELKEKDEYKHNILIGSCHIDLSNIELEDGVNVKEPWHYVQSIGSDAEVTLELSMKLIV